VVFHYPTIAKTSDRKIKAHINDTATLQCQFSASSVKDVTVVVWTKDDMAINSSDHYTIKTFTKPAIDDLIISDLIINSIIAADQGKYSCYCYYNRELVMSSKPVISNQKYFRIYFKKHGDGFPVGYAGIGLATVSLFLLGLVIVLFVYIRHRRHLNDAVPGKTNGIL